jgi:hypothetical protein
MDSPPEALPVPEQAAPAPRSVVTRLRPLLPWLSLVTGIAGAVLMDRGPKRAAGVALCAVALWLTLLSLHGFARLDPERGGPRRRLLLRAVRHSTLLATQSLVQLTLFFALPFYYKAASLHLGHIVFMGALGLSCAASLWDPLTEWLLSRPLRAPLLPAIGSFVALNAVLPALGMSTRTSLWIAACTSVSGVVLLSAFNAPAGRRVHVTLLALLGALLLPLALVLGLARIVPAAPLRLVSIEFGTRIANRWVADPAERFEHAPQRLFCATAIASPIGVRDRLFHVWRYDGEQRARIELDIRGGRGAGWRTFSRVQLGGVHAGGTYRCSVETASGQVLGEKSVRVGPPG